MKIQGISHLSVYVLDQEEALAWYEENFGFVVQVDDRGTVPGFRWLTISPPENDAIRLVLFLARGEEIRKVGQSPMCVLEVDNCHEAVAQLTEKSVTIVRPVEEVPWGLQAVVLDLYGNPYCLVQSP